MKPVLASSSLVGQPKMEGAAEWTAIGLENRGMALTVGVRFLHLPLFPLEAEKRGTVLITQR